MGCIGCVYGLTPPYAGVGIGYTPSHILQRLTLYKRSLIG